MLPSPADDVDDAIRLHPSAASDAGGMQQRWTLLHHFSFHPPVSLEMRERLTFVESALEDDDG